MLLSSSLSEINVSWSTIDYGDGVSCCTDRMLSPGTYYVMVEGKNETQQNEYYLYTYWCERSEFTSFGYDVFYQDMFG